MIAHHPWLARTALTLACSLASSSTLVQTLAAEDEPSLPLPAWTDDDMRLLNQEPESIPLGGYLWPDGLDPNSILPPDTSPARVPPDSLLAEESGDLVPTKNRGGFLLFIPKPRPLVSEKAQTVATPPQKLVEVGSDFLTSLEDSEPDACLLDPHSLLAETESEDLRRLLAYHAGEAHTFANFLLLGSDEQLPPSADLSHIAHGRLIQDHACLAVYPLAEPWRARLFMTHEITESVPTTYLRVILKACVQDALQASDPVEQLQRFATQLSIRLIWMERAYPHVFTATEEEAPADTAAPVVLSEVTKAPDPGPKRAPSFLLRWKPLVLIGAGALVGLVVLIVSVRAILRWRRRRAMNSVWLLPEVETSARFGGPHCGQGGVWIRYS